MRRGDELSAGRVSARDAAIVIAAGLALVGAGLMLLVRFGERGGPLRLAGVGRLSRVTHAMIALAALGAAHQLAAHALGWGMRAPWALTVTVIVVGVLGSIALDALETGPEDERGNREDHR